MNTARTLVLLTLFMVAGTVEAWAQTQADITDVDGLNAMTADGSYIIKADIDASSYTASIENFSGTLEAAAKADGTFYTISGLQRPLFGSVNGGTVRNIIMKNISVSDSGTTGNVGAICGEATGASRIYNCGVLSTTSTISGSTNVGSIVGLLNGTSRVVNCYSYATVSGGTMMGGIVGRNNQTSTMSSIKTIVVNCMFYGEISGAVAGSAFPVYGGNVIANNGTNAINNYNYFRSDAEFDNVYTNISNYNRSWPAEEKYLTRFEYYRNILNSNRHLCTFWATGKTGTEQTAADTALIAKWVLDPSIAPYPILKKWGKYPSVINPVPVNSLGTLKVTVSPGAHNSSALSKEITLTITDMDEANHDYGYYKVQLPYYNELFGAPTSNDHVTRYGNNYTDMVVTGWNITSVKGGTDISDKTGIDADGVAYDHTFTANWESGYNFADRYCTEKDLFNKSGRVFAQGGYYYVPEGVTEIAITAHWGTAVYVRNAENSVDRINVTNAVGSGSAFTPAGTLPTTFQGQTVFNSIQDAIKSSSFSNIAAGKTVYDQAVVLVGNVQVRNGSNVVNYTGTNARPYTLMSADFDLDNEPDFCLQLQFRNDLERPRIQPVRFDFLSVPELGLAIRPDSKAWAIGIMVPAGHFEITETACMHTTQFEYDGVVSKQEGPMILNGGHFEQIVVRYGSTAKGNGNADRTSYFIMGGHFWMKRFTPGNHASTGNKAKVRHCAINVIGGEIPELYLSGIYRPLSSTDTYNDNPHCYINGGRFGTIAGAGMEQISGNITFKIDHAIIDEFYGGGINASLPVLGNIDVTIDHSRVGKYCGGPKVGILGTTSAYKTVTTHATGSTFGEFYGGGNGGTSYYREQKQDGDAAFPAQSADGWKNYGYSGFNPLNTISSVTKASDNSATNKGYHGEYEFEVFNNSNGTNDNAVVRAYYQWVQFGSTATGTVTNFLKDCTVNGDFYGGGNLGNVNGDVYTTLTGSTHVTGSAFAAGYSAAIPKFRIHDKENATTDNFPARDFAGVITEHTLDYKKDASGNEIYYTWTNELPPGTTSSNAKNNPTFQKDGKWYCYTWVSLENLGAVSGKTTLNIDGSTQIDGDVYGGGNESAVEGDVEVNMKNGNVTYDIYGGGALANTNTSTTGGSKTTTVNLLGGIINRNVYGGGKGRLAVAATETTPAITAVEALVGGNVLVNVNGLATTDYVAANHSSVVTGIDNDGDGTPEYYLAKVGGVVKGSVFGCNNLNGTPKGSVTVHVYKTQGYAGHYRTGKDAETANEREAMLNDIDDAHHSYEVAAVYGGGNLAAYEPTDLENGKTQVIIDGCDLTSIRQVYGGGNAASTPATQVEINGTYEIEEVFGGGNGKDRISRDGGSTYIANPGANVGYRNYTVYDTSGNPQDATDATTPADRTTNYGYGTGQANVNIHGGLIHRVYGGSNTKGNVRQAALTMLEDANVCEFSVEQAYGGGKSAPMDGSAHLEMACIPGLKVAYGGAESADIQNNVTLNITNGNFDRVFGGNNVSGTISGTITVNIEETGCKPVIIGQLYGGGNQAAYSAPFVAGSTTVRQPGPTLNVRSFTSIGEIYGGGYGKTAKITGDTYVNVNVCDGQDFSADETKTKIITDNTDKTRTISFSEYVRTDDGDFETDTDGNRLTTKQTVSVYMPGRSGLMGGINTIFGGGNAAEVDGNTHVNIGTQAGSEITFATPAAQDEASRKHEVKGANIVGNVYGGGNNAVVTGNANVQIGKRTDVPSPAPAATTDSATAQE